MVDEESSRVVSSGIINSNPDNNVSVVVIFEFWCKEQDSSSCGIAVVVVAV